MIYNAKQLANQLKLIRLKNNWNQSDVARRIGVKQSTISNFENHPEKTQLATLFKILQALDTDIQISVRQHNAPENLATESDEDW